MASTFSKLRDDIDDDLEAQIVKLRKDVSSLRKSLSRRGAAADEDTRDSASDLYEDLMSRLNDALPDLAKRSRAVKRAARDNPVATTVLGVVVVGLLVGLLSRR